METSTYGYFFVSALNFVENIIYLRNTLRCLGLPTRQKIYMIEDTKYVIDRDIQPHDKLHKSRTELYFHWSVRILHLRWLPFTTSIEAITHLSKHWIYTNFNDVIADKNVITKIMSNSTGLQHIGFTGFAKLHWQTCY